ncbi:MAG: ABC transporter permease [marine benthic group bacterium]|nr:ABC transporter permease [Gemmatimonadota bacterium]MCL7963577.1 ABC transporter permease [Candidatus Carthagonibacter metallireducens]MCL7938134.1 ABC transporter permease [Gemmatimonadota bacterium]MCL7957357.1 ABC transporter permease [Gemmatimonadota bacterium]MCL7970232.1 ABC transporter permease [Gemmatimonadota bacterium]
MTGPRIEATRGPEGLTLTASGQWDIEVATPDAQAVERAVTSLGPGDVLLYDTADLEKWDSGLLALLLRLESIASDRGAKVDRRGLPDGAGRLLALAESSPAREDARRSEEKAPVVDRVGTAALDAIDEAEESVTFLGETTRALGRFLTGRSRYRKRDLWLLVQQAGAGALGIVSLVSFLLGAILAFVGAVQLQQFGATIYVANLVGVAMARDMGALMTAIVMSGRSGAAYAAQLGSMKVNQETDALVTLGISPVEFLVVPRVLALSSMMPLLTLYSVLMGIAGGALVGMAMLDLSLTTYWNQTLGALSITGLVGGLFKALVYGVLIALAGCREGMRCGGSASAVGDAATAAVVSSIVAIISAAGVFAWVFYVLGI